MEILVWSLLIIFMLHDFEELIMVEAWQKKYSVILKKQKRAPFAHWKSPDSGAAAVCVEFVVLLIISLCSFRLKTYLIWFATFFVFTFHLVIHIIMSVQFRHYTPGVFTSAIFLPLSVFIMYTTALQLTNSWYIIVLTCFITTIIFLVFFYFLTKSITFFYNQLNKYATVKK